MHARTCAHIWLHVGCVRVHRTCARGACARVRVCASLRLRLRHTHVLCTMYLVQGTMYT